MTSPTLKFTHIGAVALAVNDFERAIDFYTNTLSLPPAYEEGKRVGNQIGDTVLMFKTDWYAKPSDNLNPRLTLETENALDTEAALRAKDVVITDTVAPYGAFLVGGFLDSEGNKLWFCSKQPPA